MGMGGGDGVVKGSRGMVEVGGTTVGRGSGEVVGLDDKSQSSMIGDGTVTVGETSASPV